MGLWLCLCAYGRPRSYVRGWVRGGVRCVIAGVESQSGEILSFAAARARGRGRTILQGHELVREDSGPMFGIGLLARTDHDDPWLPRSSGRRCETARPELPIHGSRIQHWIQPSHDPKIRGHHRFDLPHQDNMNSSSNSNGAASEPADQVM